MERIEHLQRHGLGNYSGLLTRCKGRTLHRCFGHQIVQIEADAYIATR